jgi:dolichyl-phosphate-mannose--protein O-mannosyl transferase
LRLGLGDWNASIATLSVVLSSVFLPLATTFMSDVPGLFAILVCLYCCLRAVPEQSPAATIAWLAGAALSNDVLGTAGRFAGWGCSCWSLQPPGASAAAEVYRSRPRPSGC